MTIVGKNEIYNGENVVGPFLIHTLLGPRQPPPPSLTPLPCPEWPGMFRYCFGHDSACAIAHGTRGFVGEKEGGTAAVALAPPVLPVLLPRNRGQGLSTELVLWIAPALILLLQVLCPADSQGTDVECPIAAIPTHGIVYPGCSDSLVQEDPLRKSQRCRRLHGTGQDRPLPYAHAPPRGDNPEMEIRARALSRLHAPHRPLPTAQRSTTHKPKDNVAVAAL